MFLYSKFIYTQLKSFSLIVFLITFALIIQNSKYNIIPLNIITFFGSIILNHYYPNYYKIVNIKAPEFILLWILNDFIIHYLPLIFILIYVINNKKIETNYTLCIIILVLYIILFNSEFLDIYFNFDQYFSKEIII
jgi:hypothetical protein